ncbi:Protein of unknown function [Cotesia congregata]|uniref:Uncharacterized protein n=1 Tax=Cotesia congregata TaxID=51543 RepID=A0A8J2HCD7_COTCN|nr:Protein of unknown function [Cotesia congregata]
MSQLYFLLLNCTTSDLPRSRVSTITNDITDILQHSSVKILFNQLLNRFRQLGESSNNIAAYTTMLNTLLNPFSSLSTENQCLQYFENCHTYIPPVEVKIGEKFIYKSEDDHTTIAISDLYVHVIPLRNVFTKFFHLPHIFENTIAYLNTLQNENIIISNSTGITINTSAGPTQLYFSLAGVIGDNLAIHTLLGFIGSFSSHHQCRFCYIKRDEINRTFNESMCNLRTVENYNADVIKNTPSETGVAR